MIISANTTNSGSVVHVGWKSGETARFHSVWLRDNSLDPTTRNVDNGQRLETIRDIDPSITVGRIEIVGDGEALLVTFAPDGVTSRFLTRWLFDHRYDRLAASVKRQSGWISDRHETWTNLSMRDLIPRASWPEYQQSSHLRWQWLRSVDRYGFAVLDGLPRVSGALCRVAETFGFVRETNYGKWFDVVAEVTPHNLANTNLGLQAHTDNPYRDPVPTLQILACLENSVDGGETAIIDGFAIARFMQEHDRPAFEILTRFPIRFAYEGSNDVSLASKRPIFELGPDGELLAVRFNNRSAAPFVDVPFDDMESFYRAYRIFAACV